MAENPDNFEWDKIKDKVFAPYALALGMFMRDWNDLQYKFSHLFSDLVDATDYQPGMTIWHAIPNDRLQRRALLALASYKLNTKHQLFILKKPVPAGVDPSTRVVNDTTDRIFEEIRWLVDSTDKLGPSRDAAAHSPYTINVTKEVPFLTFASNTFFGDLKAKELKGKDLIAEFRLYGARAQVLKSHVDLVQMSLILRDQSIAPFRRPKWPGRAK